MKKIYILLATLLVVFACQKPQYVLPTAERQGITSLTAYFTTGQYADQELAKLYIADPEETYYVIEVPWYFPEESENSTMVAMTRAKVRAELAPNCKIEPPLGILDLTDENKFTFTNPQGESRKIIITGKRVKSKRTTLLSFDLVDPYPVGGFVDAEEAVVYLFTREDLNGFTATATACAHATIETDLSVVKDYNEEQEVTVVAQDGKTKQTYKIIKKEPVQIPYGYNKGSEKRLFNIDPVTRLGLPPYTTAAHPSLAAIGGKLIISVGDGSTPIYINGMTGVKEGTINLGGVICDAITSDEAGHLLIVERADAYGTVSIYTTSSLTEAPTLLCEVENIDDTPVGYHVKVCGDVTASAQILLTNEGVDGVTGSGAYIRVVVEGGTVVETRYCEVASKGLLWGSAPTRAAKVVPAGPGANDGEFFSWYGDNSSYFLYYISSTGTLAQKDMTTVAPVTVENAWGYNFNCLDAKSYNGAYFLVQLISSHFPEWGYGPLLYLYDAASPSMIKSANAIAADTSIEWYQKAAHTEGAADVVISQSSDGFRMFVYYYDFHAQVVGGYTMDSIKR